MLFSFLYLLLKMSIKPKPLPQFSHFYYLCAEYSEMADAKCPQVAGPEFFLSPLKVVFYTAEPRKKERPRDWQKLFAITRFRFFEVFFHIFYYYGVNKIVRFTEDFVV